MARHKSNRPRMSVAYQPGGHEPAVARAIDELPIPVDQAPPNQMLDAGENIEKSRTLFVVPFANMHLTALRIR